MKGMRRTFLFVLVTLMFFFTGIPVKAADSPVIYEKTITVTADGGSYQIGFVNVEFKKDCLDATQLPITFDAKVYCINGQPGISFTPGVSKFYKQVHIRVDSYSGLLYDATSEQNIYVDIKKEQILAPHFSFWSLD